jgi:hypothetical protein
MRNQLWILLDQKGQRSGPAGANFFEDFLQPLHSPFMPGFRRQPSFFSRLCCSFAVLMAAISARNLCMRS